MQVLEVDISIRFQAFASPFSCFFIFQSLKWESLMEFLRGM